MGQTQNFTERGTGGILPQKIFPQDSTYRQAMAFPLLYIVLVTTFRGKYLKYRSAEIGFPAFSGGQISMFIISLFFSAKNVDFFFIKVVSNLGEVVTKTGNVVARTTNICCRGVFQ